MAAAWANWTRRCGSRAEVLVGSVLSGVGAHLSVRFLSRYVRTRTPTPFAIHCLVVGIGSVIYLNVRQLQNSALASEPSTAASRGLPGHA
jgi:hypothetical protein